MHQERRGVVLVDLMATNLIPLGPKLVAGAAAKRRLAAAFFNVGRVNACQSEWAARARRSLKFCEMQVHVSRHQA